MLDAPAMYEWVREAKAGDAAVYVRGEALPREIAAMATTLASQGLVDLTQRREGRGWSYIIQRRSKRFEPIDGRRPARRCARATPETMILRMIRHAIRFKQPCPTNIEFADGAYLSGREAASYRLRKLVAAGKIALIDHGPFEHRVAVDLETGQATVRAKL
ncbi:hypothetical protein HZY97_20300 [Sphingomonas sp. R-74633]|uniref:hypothetical protein n=1 Tax=Sphingomonas sp. R-74633 TaxID=2751188 RepID=UPI0015D2F080|nr:hypothetical protein [Sphingomonas sp. R-74633]NYT43128.1 hypothetical protein [Sphingomonas sp. R-74633]